MKLAIRNADLERDRRELIRFLNENLTKDPHGNRFDWLYLRNPGGPARAWIATDTATDQIVGVAAAFPRHFWMDGLSRRVWVLGDFCVSNQARSLGPALRLQRDCLSALSEESWYDFPSRSMIAVYKRMGLPPSAQAVRYAKLLRVDGKLENLVPAVPVARSFSRAGNILLRLRSRPVRPLDFEVSSFEGRFGEDFNELNARSTAGNYTQGQRTAEFLNWRYRDDPSTDYHVLTARKGPQLLGFVAGQVRGTEAFLVDVKAIDEEKTVPSMVSAMEELLRERGVHSMSAPILAGPKLLQCLRSLGFHPRETWPVVVHNDSRSGWQLLASDRDS